MSGLGGASPPGLAARPGDDRRQPRAGAELGSGDRLPVHVAQRPRLHEPLPLRQAGDLQGARLLRRRRHRHGALLGPAGDADDARSATRRPGSGARRRPRSGRPARPMRAKRLLFTGDSLTGERRSSGAWHRVGAAGRARRALRAPPRAGGEDADQPAGDDEADGEPGAPLAGAAPTQPSAPSSTASPATPRRATRSSAAPPRRVSRGGPRARRALRRPRHERFWGGERARETPPPELDRSPARAPRAFLPGSFPGDLGIEPLEVEEVALPRSHPRRNPPPASRRLRPRRGLDRARRHRRRLGELPRDSPGTQLHHDRVEAQRLRRRRPRRRDRRRGACPSTPARAPS